MTAKAVLVELAGQQADTQAQKQWQQSRLHQLEAERLKLLQAHYADAIPLDLLKSEQARIGAEVASLQTALKVTLAAAHDLQANANAAVALLDDCHQTYLSMNDRERRLMNQAIFHAVWVTETGIVGWEYNQPFATLMRTHGAQEPRLIVGYQPSAQTEADDTFQTTSDQPHYRRSQGRWARASFCRGLNQTSVAEREGFEPSDP